MKILWISMNSGLRSSSISGYKGGNWISSLQMLAQECPQIDLAVAYLTSDVHEQEQILSGTHYYPIYSRPLSRLSKFKRYYGKYRSIDGNAYVAQMLRIIKDAKPEIIQLFGLENQLATILGKTEIPIVVHLQGLLGPCDNAFFPVGMNKSSFVWPLSIREWILRNGYIFAKNDIRVRGKYERSLFKRVKYVMGRTEWDYEVSQLLAPESKYYHVDEVLRPCFYGMAGMYEMKNRKRFVIVSTISETIYKGLDLVLKTALLLKAETNLDFEWRIAGINADSDFVQFFEKNIKSEHVNVKYLGVLHAEKLCEALLDANVYVHPSYIDNSPNSVCEAQMLGVPVVATYVGGMPSLVEDKKIGYLVPANAPYELAYRLKEIANHPEDASRIGRAGSIAAQERHNKEKILNELINSYRAILEL